MTLNQYRLLYWAIAQIPNFETFYMKNSLPAFRITCEDFAALTESLETEESLFKHLKETVEKMQSVKVAWWDEERQKNIVAVLVPTITYKEGANALKFNINEYLKPHLLNLKKKISQLQITETIKLKNSST